MIPIASAMPRRLTVLSDEPDVKFSALALDFDGTIARNDVLDPDGSRYEFLGPYPVRLTEPRS